MFIGAKFVATVNGKGFNQSQLLVMCEIFNWKTIRGKLQIELFAAPLGVSHFDTRNGHIDQGAMIADGWKPVKLASHRRGTSHHMVSLQTGGNILCGMLGRVL